MKVFVTGGTGFVGREVLRQLAAAGHSMRILVRDSRPERVRGLTTAHPAEVREGNVLDSRSLPDVLSGVDAVIHLVGIISEVGQNRFENVHTRGTENVVSAACKAGVRRFIHMSALGTRADAVSRYHRSKFAAEEIVRRSGLDYTIFQPSVIYGPGDAFVNLFAAIARRSPILPVIGAGRSKVQPIAVEDVARCFVAALVQPGSVGQTYELCGREIFALEETLDLILDVTGRKRLKLHLPLWVARAQAGFLEFVFPRLLGKAPPLNRDQLLMLQEDNIGDAQPAMDLFGISPGPFREGIKRYLVRDA